MISDFSSIYPALHKNKWVCFYIYNPDNTSADFIRFIATLSEKILKENHAERVLYFRGGKNQEILFLTFYTSHYITETILKKEVYNNFRNYYSENPLPEDFLNELSSSYFTYGDIGIDVEENYMHYGMSKGGWNVFNQVTSELMQQACITTNTLAMDQDWSIETAIQKQIPLLYILLNEFRMDRNEMSNFIQWVWNRMMIAIDLTGVEDPTEWNRVFMDGIEQNYRNQQDFFTGYTDYLLNTLDQGEDLEDELLNAWQEHCQLAGTRFGKLVSEDVFVKDDTDGAEPELWLYLEVILHSISNSLGVTTIYAYNVMYAIRESLKKTNFIDVS